MVEPPEMFRRQIPERYADQAPKIVRRDDGSDVWTFNGAVIPSIGLNAVAGRDKGRFTKSAGVDIGALAGKATA